MDQALGQNLVKKIKGFKPKMYEGQELLSLSEKKWLEEMSRLFLYKELRLPLEKEKSQEREKRIAPFIKKIGAGSILLCRVGISYLAKALRSSTGEPSLDEFTKAVEKKDQFEKKLEDLKNQGQMVMPVRKFIKSFFADPKKTKQLNAFDCQYYKVFYHYHYYLVLEKFFDYV